MPGPISGGVFAHNEGHQNCKTGKTRKDKESGKWARRLANRHRDPIREAGGKQFKK